jgi:myo-inositol-1(or 4)-monophosphatase
LELRLRALAVQIAQTAAEHVRRRRPEIFGGDGTRADAVSEKSSATDPVTVADTESERLIRDLLARSRPDDAVLGEEQGDAAGRSPVRWVVDPIDGTVNFVYGIPAYAVSIAAEIDGRAVAGAVVDVARRIVYSAALGYGATRQGPDDPEPVALHCTDVDSTEMALVATGFGYRAQRRAQQAQILVQVLPQVRDIRRVGSAALDLCMVASGLVDAHYEHGTGPWDWAAGALIAAEAGAHVLIPGPDPAAGELLFACAPGVADELTALLRSAGAFAPIPD